MQSDELSDSDLLQRCRGGDAAAWAVLVRRFQRLVYTVPRRAGLGEAQAADVFQTTFTRLVEHADRITDPSRLQAWLVTTAKRESLRLVEASRRFVTQSSRDDDAPEEDPLADLHDPGLRPDELIDDLQQHHRLRRAVDRLDARSRQFVELEFLQDEPLPYAEIATRLRIAEGSIGPTRARCLAKLRTLLESA